MAQRCKSYEEFWPVYLREHSRAATRGLHYFGTALGLALFVAAIIAGRPWLLLAAVVSGYLFAWLGHAFVERNRPATFTHPFWSLISDFRMFWLWLSGRLRRELERYGLA